MAKYGTAPGELTDPLPSVHMATAPLPSARCGRCYHWRPLVEGRGRCYRFPPVVVPGGQGRPVTGETEVCGEFAPALA